MAVGVAHGSAPDEAPASVHPLQLFTPPCFLQPRFGCLPVYVVPSLQVTVTFLALAFATDVLLAPEEDCGAEAAKTCPPAANNTASTHAEMILFIVIDLAVSDTKRDPSRTDAFANDRGASSRVRLLIRCGGSARMGRNRQFMRPRT